MFLAGSEYDNFWLWIGIGLLTFALFMSARMGIYQVNPVFFLITKNKYENISTFIFLNQVLVDSPKGTKKRNFYW